MHFVITYNVETCCNSVDMCCNTVDTCCNNAKKGCNNVEWNTLPICDVRPRGGFMPLVHEVDVRKYNERESDKGKTHNVGFFNGGNDQVTATFRNYEDASTFGQSIHFFSFTAP